MQDAETIIYESNETQVTNDIAHIREKLRICDSSQPFDIKD